VGKSEFLVQVVFPIDGRVEDNFAFLQSLEARNVD